MTENTQEAHAFNILVALENEVARRGLYTMIESVPEIARLCGCVNVADGTRELAENPDIDVVIISPDQDCRPLKEAAAQRQNKEINVLALLQDSDRQNLQELATCPLDGFLLESDLTIESLSHALATLRRGEMPIPSTLAREMLVHVRRRTLLTPREKVVLALLLEGLSNKQIARRLSISDHGAKRHVANVLAKLNCSNRTSAVVKAIDMGLVTSPRN